MATVFVKNPSGYYQFTQSPSGDVQSYIRRLANTVALLARGQVGKKTGRLAASIGVSTELRGGGRVWYVGSSNGIALIHHEGTRPHYIYPRHKRMLRFVSRGRVVYARFVYHPGTRANRYLTDPLRRVI